jgi:signal transduction histidine kinase
MLAETKTKPAAETAGFQERLVAMNEALVLGSVRQHEFTEAAERANGLLEAEICERKLAEEALRLVKAQLIDRAGQLERLVAERTSELSATNEQLEAFVYSIAHDLRAPLRIMQGYSTMLVKNAGVAMDESARDYANRINKSALFMDALLIDLLAFSRVSQQAITLTSVSLKKVVESVLSRLQSEIKEKNAQVESAASWPFVQAHETTLAQVLINLVGNALKFVAPNVPPIIRLRAEEAGGFIRFWVEDNGPGIPPNSQGEVFHLFTRLHAEKYEGTGLGLAIVQKGVERMGGRVGVISIADQGCRFWFDLRPPPLAL